MLLWIRLMHHTHLEENHNFNLENSQFIMNLIQFTFASILLTLMPGPDIIFVVTQSVTQGKKSGIMIALGLCTGLIFHISAAALGLSLLIYNSEIAFTILKYIGAAYLIYLGILALINRNKDSFDLDFNDKKEVKKLYSKGILMNILNPKVSLFFLAFMPQFIKTDQANISLQIIILGLIFIIQAILIFIAVSYLADKLASKLLKNMRASKVLNWIKSLIYLGIGIELILAR